MGNYHFYEPALGHGLAHDPLNSIIAPRPIGWVSSLGASGFRNLAPYSFFQLFNYVPPIIGFSSIGWKDSVANIAETGEFVWNLASRPLAEAMNATSASVPRGADEFALAGIEAAPSRLVKPPRVAAAPAAFECKLIEIHQLKRADGQAVESWLVLGEVVGIHLARETIVDGVYQTAAAQPVLRGGGWGDYFEVTEGAKFRMKRPD